MRTRSGNKAAGFWGGFARQPETNRDGGQFFSENVKNGETQNILVVDTYVTMEPKNVWSQLYKSQVIFEKI